MKILTHLSNYLNYLCKLVKLAIFQISSTLLPDGTEKEIFVNFLLDEYCTFCMERKKGKRGNLLNRKAKGNSADLRRVFDHTRVSKKKSDAKNKR